TPIVERPEDARLSEEMRKRVTTLSARCVVSIISGRDLSDIQKMVGIKGVYYAGSHGFHLLTPEGVVWEKKEANKLLPLLDRAEERLREVLSSIEGVLVERKKYAIAVHYRRADEKIIPCVKREVEMAKEGGLRLSYAKKVFELQPDIDWDKGRVVTMIMDDLDTRKDLFPIYIGDDLTDEDAFGAVKGVGCAILVGDRDETLADYRLDQADVGAFLEALGRYC
ncbi:trehalose-phosphatase, partial [Methanosarcinales archaeon]